MSFFIPSSRTPVCQLINPVALYHKHDFVSTVMRSFVPFRHTGPTVVPGIAPVSAGEPQARNNTKTKINISLRKIVVVRDVLLDGGEAGIFYGCKDIGTGIMDLWFAGVSEPEGEDDFHCAFKWRGSPDEGWFALSQSNDAGMNPDAVWEVLAGGEVESNMAFRAIIADGGVPEDYYIVTTLDNIESATPEEVVPILSADMPDYEEGALAFIDETNDLCLGFLNSYPTQLSDVDWVE